MIKVGLLQVKRRRKERRNVTQSFLLLTTAGYVQVQKQAVLALVGQEHVQTFQLLVSA